MSFDLNVQSTLHHVSKNKLILRTNQFRLFFVRTILYEQNPWPW